ncbi:MAG: metal-sensitive transcriptional regulator [Chloroflexi bacterium]|nr:metal-sensitive transcriptional regulator [Chloroflexota bacterium]
MSELPVPRETVIARLKKVEGQIQGIERMIAAERDCVDILIQLAAVRSAIDSAASLVMKNYAHICLAKHDDKERALDELARAMALWVGGKMRG